MNIKWIMRIVLLLLLLSICSLKLIAQQKKLSLEEQWNNYKTECIKEPTIQGFTKYLNRGENKMKKIFKDEEVKETQKEEKKNSFDESDIKAISKKITIQNDLSNQTVLQRIEYKGKKFLAINKMYSKKDSNIWLRGKAIWLNDEIGKELFTHGLDLYKEKKK